MAGQRRKNFHRCGCDACRSRADRQVVKLHEAINRVLATLGERDRRLFAGLLARQHGRGGVRRVAEITGLSRMTIRRGRREIERSGLHGSSRIRRPGAGRRRVEKKVPAWSLLWSNC